MYEMQKERRDKQKETAQPTKSILCHRSNAGSSPHSQTHPWYSLSLFFASLTLHTTQRPSFQPTSPVRDKPPFALPPSRSQAKLARLRSRFCLRLRHFSDPTVTPVRLFSQRVCHYSWISAIRLHGQARVEVSGLVATIYKLPYNSSIYAPSYSSSSLILTFYIYTNIVLPVNFALNLHHILL